MIYYILNVLIESIKIILIGGEDSMLLVGDVTDLTFRSVIDAIAVLIVVWYVIKNYLDMRDRSIKGLTRRQGWDKAAKVLEEKEKVWDEGLEDIYKERKLIVDRYDKRLDEIEERIDENHTDTEAKIQELKSDMLILTECMRAVLDGLHQLNCNGRVTEASEKLDSYLIGLVGRS